MKEVKRPKKPLLYYYGIVMLVLILFNLIAMPWIAQRQIQEVDYGTFMTMTEEKNIGRVEIQSNQILFTDKEETAASGFMSHSIFSKTSCTFFLVFFHEINIPFF